MKYYICLFLVSCLAVLMAFVGCSEETVTPTNLVSEVASTIDSDISTESVVDNELDASVEEKKENDSVQSTVSQNVSDKKDEDKQKDKDSQKGNSVASSSQSVNSSQAQTNNKSSYVQDIVKTYPEFTTEAKLKNWLQGKNTAYRQDDISTTLSILSSNGSVYYYRPLTAIENSQFSLHSISLNPSSGMFTFNYNVTNDEPELVVFVCRLEEKSTNRMYDLLKKSYESETENLSAATVNNIDYYCEYVPASDKTFIVWKQFGNSHMAVVNGRSDQIDSILPSLRLEQVVVNNNPDHVTE